MVRSITTYVALAAWTLLAVFLLAQTVALVAWLRPAARSDVMTLGAASALAFVGVTFGVLTTHRDDRPLRETLGLRPTAPALAVFGIALGLVLQVPATQLRGWIETLYPTPEAVLLAKAALFGDGSPRQVLALLVSVVCIGPLVEEIFFRGALFRMAYRGVGIVGAAVATGILFTLGHIELREFPALLLVAAVLSHLRAASGSLVPCLALHVTFNAATTVGVLTDVYSLTEPTDFGPAATALGWVATGGLVFAVQYVAASSDEAEQARSEDGA